MDIWTAVLIFGLCVGFLGTWATWKDKQKKQ